MNHENFAQQVAASEVLKKRYDQISDYVVNAIQEKTGITVPKASISKLNCVQISTYSGSDDYLNQWENESVMIDEIRIARERERLQTALESGDDSVESRQIANRLAEMPPEQRISFARQNGLTGAKAKTKTKDHTPEQKAALIRENDALPTSQLKIAHARKHGLN